MKFPFPVLFVVMLLMGFAFGCKKEAFTTSPSAQLSTSIDTVKFDTLFTTTGSTSRLVKIFNTNSKGIRINSIQLRGGQASPFKINVDGIPGPEVHGLEIDGGDSAYIFVTLSINPTATNLPFLVEDSIEINYNGLKKKVQLQAWGQNAHFLRNHTVTGNEVWNKDRPYVILERLTIAPGATLTINAGSRIYFHADAPMLIGGSLQVAGGAADSNRVVFSGDRLDEPYRNFPASFPGLIFTETSNSNLLQYAIVKNAYQGIVVVDPAQTGTKLTLQETIIENAYDAGLLGINTSINARNLLISNCGKSLMLVKGGDHQFNHCTVTGVSTLYVAHKDPVLLLTDFLNANNTIVTRPLNAVFNNCIFWGESGGFVDQEVVLLKQGNSFSAQFNDVLWSTAATPPLATVSGNNIRNQDPLFDTVNVSGRVFRYSLKAGSPAINKGSASSVSLDLDGKPRPVGLPDLGAYEKQ